MLSAENMFTGTQHQPSNLLLNALPGESRPELLRALVPIELTPGMRLSEPGRKVEQLFFPVSGSISTEAITHRGESTLINLIGLEGFAGWCGLLDHPQHMNTVEVLTPGRALRLKIGTARQEFERGERFTRLAHAAMYMQVAQIGQSVLCNRLHPVSERLARWILELHARTREEHILITHEMLARMLGARRSSVTVAATELQDDGMIEYRRGKVRVLDQPRLERAACECYGIVREAYREMLRAYAAEQPPAPISVELVRSGEATTGHGDAERP